MKTAELIFTDDRKGARTYILQNVQFVEVIADEKCYMLKVSTVDGEIDLYRYETAEEAVTDYEKFVSQCNDVLWRSELRRR